MAGARHPELTAAAALLRAKRDALAGELAALVAGWPKYAEAYAADPAGFAQLETAVLVDYVAELIGGGDENYRHLYVGEKAKQFHDPAADPAERKRREAVLLGAERAIFAAALADHAPGRAVVEAEFDRIEHVLTADAPATARLLLVGDCLYLDVVAFLTGLALADGVRLQPSYVTGHDAGELKAAIGRLADERFDAVFFSPFTYALLSDYEGLQRPRAMLAPFDAARHVRSAVAEAMGLFETLADLFDCPLFVHAPAPILRHDGSLADRLRGAATAPARRSAIAGLRRRLAERVAARRAAGQVVRIIDEYELIGDAGVREAGRLLYQADLQHPAAFGAMVAAHYRDIVAVVGRLLKRKVVVSDLDNTLWDGVIGEGLGITHHYPRQDALLKLKARGIVLTINSKNDPAKAVWDAEEGRLGLDHFVSRQINWDPKPLNIRRIAEHLNLKEKDFVFIDDRADERALVQEQFPALWALDAIDERSWRLLSLWADLLPENPNADRTEFYRQRDARQAFLASEAESDAAARDAMYADLGLTFAIREAGAEDLTRVAELINRTNQFNMAGSRVTKRQVEEWAASPDARILVGDAADRFGEMGTVSVLVATRLSSEARIPIFVLSCRAFGYGMDMAMLEAARRLAPGLALTGDFAETPFNQPCREVYPSAGFERIEGGWRRNGAGGDGIAVPAWLAVDRNVPAFAGFDVKQDA